MSKIIDSTNLGYLISKIKAAFWPKSDIIQIGLDNAPTANSNNLVKSGGVKSALDTKQETLVSGTNIKTINNESLLGSGNISITGGSGGEANVIEAVTFNGTPATITNKTAAITATIPDAQVQSDWNATSGMGVILNKPTIPAAVTESTVAGWGFTKNAGTLTAETDPVYSASPAAGITSNDITNWNKVATGSMGYISEFNGVAGIMNSMGSYCALPEMGDGTEDCVLATTDQIPTESTVSGWGFTKNTGTYSKPSGGIPATDLASAVQTSLGKADTALQSFTETDPTVPSWAKASTKPTYTASEVGALPLAGGTMDSGAEIYLPGSSSLGETKVTRNGVNVSPNANSFSTVTSYKHGSILYSPDGLSLNTISLPAATGTIALTSDIPSAVTESTVSGWGFTKNAGTVTGVKINGTTKTPTSGTVDLGTVLTSETALSKGTTTGSGNAVTDISVNGHQITLTKGTTFLTSETSLSKGTTTGSGNVVTDLSVSGHTITLTKGSTVPVATSANAGKIPRITSAGAWEYVTPAQIYSGSAAPNNSNGNNGDIYIQT